MCDCSPSILLFGKVAGGCDWKIIYIIIIIIILLTLCVATLFIVTIGSTSVSDVLIGMPHRGRLNVLVGLLHYSPAALFHKVCYIHALLLGTR